MLLSPSSWPVQNAKARFSEMLDVCIAEGPQTITRRGVEAAVLVPIAEWKRLNETQRLSLKALLLADEGRFALDLPQRGQGRRRLPESW
jgi:prevent-host-death family protein